MATHLPMENPRPQIDLNFEGQKVRFVGTPDKPEWVAQDVCDVLGIESARFVTRDFEDYEKGVRTVHTLGGNQQLLTVYEVGVYRLIFKSRKEAAKRFQRWVFEEVLPSIRKYGTYPPPEIVIYQVSLQPYTERVIWGRQVRQKIPAGYWCVFLEGAEILIDAEHIFGPAGLEMKQYDLLDASVGRHWSTFRKGKPWAGERKQYCYTYPSGDPRGTVYPFAYPLGELAFFKTWLHNDYLLQHFPNYIRRKYGKTAYLQAIPVFAQMGVPLIEHRPRKGQDNDG